MAEIEERLEVRLLERVLQKVQDQLPPRKLLGPPPEHPEEGQSGQ